ncbi:MAG: DUF3859 domain-containing protein [Gammaproteobacteria bacterium]|nr:DUF3859 domain-containing protein [Gammaproteobacteria bacterium]
MRCQAQLFVTSVFIACGLITFSPGVLAERLNAEILEFGYYKKNSEPRRYKNPATATGYVQEGGDVELVQNTDRIPAEKNRLFGFKFRVTGLDNMLSTQLVLSVTHPKIKRNNGSIATHYSYPILLSINNGVIENQTGYSMDHEYEVVEGEWTFELWYYKQKILSQTFYTYFPDNDANNKQGSPQSLSSSDVTAK